MLPPIKDKDTFKRLQSAGLLGNYFRMWNTVQEVREAGYNGWLTVRARRASDKKLFIPTIPADAVEGCGTQLYVQNFEAHAGWNEWKRHAAYADIYLQECPAPDTGRIINLEAAISPQPESKAGQGLCVRYALNDPTNLRHSLEQRGVDVTGLHAWHVLRYYLEGDLDQLLDIWDQWPGAVIEASRFTQRVGVFDSQLICWEIREY